MVITDDANIIIPSTIIFLLLLLFCCKSCWICLYS